MEIRYEDTVSCVQCWGASNDKEPQHYQNQVYCMDQQQQAFTKSSKISLTKLKMAKKQHQFSCSEASHSQTREKIILSAMLNQQQFFLQRPASHHHVRERPKSHIPQNRDIKVIFNRESYKGNAQCKVVTTISKVRLQKKEEMALDETAKITKGYERNRSQLFQTKKVIPGTRFSLEELSQMKQSVFSICEGEEKAQIQQSTIMMDYFNPSVSRLAEFKLKCKPQQASLCSQKA